jgi:hypothetical protein
VSLGYSDIRGVIMQGGGIVTTSKDGEMIFQRLPDEEVTTTSPSNPIVSTPPSPPLALLQPSKETREKERRLVG